MKPHIRMRHSVVAVFAFILLVLTACSSNSDAIEARKKAEAKPDPPLTGRQAFQMIYPQARGWAPDAKPVQLQSFNLKQVKAEAGKAGAWEATFVSLALRRSRTFSWSAVESGGNLHKGVFAAPEQGSAGPSGQDSPFEIGAIRVDSDEAFAVALKQKETVAFMKKNPDMPLTFMLERTRRFPDLAWRVLFGESVSTSEYSVFVDATTGQYLERTR